MHSSASYISFRVRQLRWVIVRTYSSIALNQHLRLARSASKKRFSHHCCMSPDSMPPRRPSAAGPSQTDHYADNWLPPCRQRHAQHRPAQRPWRGKSVNSAARASAASSSGTIETLRPKVGIFLGTVTAMRPRACATVQDHPFRTFSVRRAAGPKNIS
jgi:hypothetical protein